MNVDVFQHRTGDYSSKGEPHYVDVSDGGVSLQILAHFLSSQFPQLAQIGIGTLPLRQGFDCVEVSEAEEEIQVALELGEVELAAPEAVNQDGRGGRHVDEPSHLVFP